MMPFGEGLQGVQQLLAAAEEALLLLLLLLRLPLLRLKISLLTFPAPAAAQQRCSPRSPLH
jgi:hypothetical protein